MLRGIATVSVGRALPQKLAAIALDAMRSLLHLEEDCAAWADRAPDAAYARQSVELFDPPPAPARVEASFVELAVEPDGTADIERVLAGLGFHRAGRRRGLPVDWWRNGHAHIVLNAAHTEKPLSVTALGVRVPDVNEVAARAHAMLWPKAASRRVERVHAAG